MHYLPLPDNRQQRLGPRSPETERIHQAFTQRKKEAEPRLKSLAAALKEAERHLDDLLDLLLILDEATEGLAPLIVAEIWREIGSFRSTGITTLVVDRNASAVLAHTERAMVLEKGHGKPACWQAFGRPSGSGCLEITSSDLRMFGSIEAFP